MQNERRKQEAKERLEELQLSNPGYAALGKTTIPEHKADEHAEQGHISKAKERGTTDTRPRNRHVIEREQ